MVIGTNNLHRVCTGPGRTKPDGFLSRCAEESLLPQNRSLWGPGELGKYRVRFLFLPSTTVSFNYCKLPLFSPPEKIIKHLNAVSASADSLICCQCAGFCGALPHDCVMTREQKRCNCDTFLPHCNHNDLATQCLYSD